MKLAIVTDSTAYLSETQIITNKIHVIAMPYQLNNIGYREGQGLTTNEFYERLKYAKKLPTTSQPPLGEVVTLYTRLAQAGYDTILSIHLSSTISGFISTLKMLAQNMSDVIKIIPYDSQITVRLMGQLVLEAARMNRAGADLESILQRLNKMRTSMGEVFIVNDLQNLVKGGRLSNASAFVGNILKIKPLLTFDPDSHRITAFEKIRSLKRAHARAESFLQLAIQRHDYPLKIFIIHGHDSVEAQKWAKKLTQKYPDLSIELSYFGPVIGTHLGDRSIALAWIRDYK